jgi:hypothetical protein
VLPEISIEYALKMLSQTQPEKIPVFALGALGHNRL